MSPEFVVLIVIMAAGFAGIFWFLSRRREMPKDTEGLVILQNQVQELVRTLDGKLAESTRMMQTQFGESAKIVKDVTERLTKLDETNRQVLNFSDQLQQLQDILKNPKQRGILGEYYLEALLQNVMPPGSFECQYKLGRDEKTGADLVVDAVVFVKDKIIPVDSKFSLENYNRIVEERDEVERGKLEKVFRQDLKNRIDETSKYVRPDLGTM